MNKINLKFKMATEKQIAWILSSFLRENNWQTKYILEMLNLDSKNWKSLSQEEQSFKLNKQVKIIFSKNKEQMKQSVKIFKKIWAENKKEIEKSFSNIFGDFKNQNCTAFSTFNYVVYPRYLDEKGFDLWFNLNEFEFLAIATHEITHFIWFDKLKKLMPHIKRLEYETPSPVWKFSEIAVDQIFENEPFLKSITQKANKKPAYDNFYTDKIGKETVIEHFRKLYKSCENIDEFIINGTNECISLFKDN